jgi:hypothetical protein
MITVSTGEIEVEFFNHMGSRMDGDCRSFAYPENKDMLKMTAQEIIDLCFKDEDTLLRKQNIHRVDLALIPDTIKSTIYHKKGE